jgi:hypothetical protein
VSEKYRIEDCKGRDRKGKEEMGKSRKRGKEESKLSRWKWRHNQGHGVKE